MDTDPEGSSPSRDREVHDTRNDLSGSTGAVVQAGNVRGDIHFHHVHDPGPSRTVPTPRQLPADPRAFVNRSDELGRLHAILTDAEGSDLAVSVHVVAGTAGAGKTSLVLHWAHQVKDRFPDGQLFVNLRGYDPGEPVTAQQAVRGFLRALGVPAADVPADADDAAALYRSLLADRRVLILLDNAATAGQVRPLLPGSGGSLVIVTSRSRLAGLAIRDGARHLTLGILPEAEAVALLRALTSGYRAQDDADRLAELARLCAGLPLALRIAAERAAAHPYMRLDDLIAELRDESALWDALSTGSDDEAEAVRTVFAWSYRALPQAAARLFRMLGVYPAPEFGLHAAAALADLTLPRTRQLLDDLVGAHLLEQTAPDRYQFHDLLRAYAADLARTEESPQERAAALHRMLDWYLRTAAAAQLRLRPAEDPPTLAAPLTTLPPLAFTDYNSAADWAEREHDGYPYLVRVAASAGFDTFAWQLAETLWNALAPSASVADWLDFGLIGLESAERAGDAAAQIRLLTTLGMAYRTMSRLDDGSSALHRALDLCRGTGNRLDEAHALNLLGLIHLRTRELAQAAAEFEQAVAGFRQMRRDRWAASALANLGSAYLAAGRLPEAADTIERALAAHRSLDNRQSIGNALWLTARLHLDREETDAALDAITEALDIALDLRNHRLEGFWLLTLGDVHRTRGEYGDALASYQRSAMLHRRLGDRSREALAWRGTARTYAAMDRPEDAAAFHRQAAAAHRDLGDAWELAVELCDLATAVAPHDPPTATAHRTEALTLLTPYPDPRTTALRTHLHHQLTTGS